MVSLEPCACCGLARGYVYAAAPYARVEGLEGAICPWCVADGRAAAKYEADFVSSIETAVPAGVADEVLKRTPGYESWQGERWLCHCDDACEFHGDLSTEELLTLPPGDEAAFLVENPWLASWDWPAVKQSYRPRGDVALYKFVCRHCGVRRLGVDLA